MKKLLAVMTVFACLMGPFSAVVVRAEDQHAVANKAEKDAKLAQKEIEREAKKAKKEAEKQQKALEKAAKKVQKDAEKQAKKMKQAMSS